MNNIIANIVAQPRLSTQGSSILQGSDNLSAVPQGLILPPATFEITADEIDQSWTVARIVKEYPPEGWRLTFEDSLPELLETSSHVERYKKETGVYPLMSELFTAFHLTRLDEVKVVIIGQDPYPTCGRSGMPVGHGLSFSTRIGEPVPVSLKNIYTELYTDIPGFKMPSSGNLEKWATQGVLMLNTCLTVSPGKPGSHNKIWMGLIKKVISTINIQRPGTIFLLWGNHAQDMERYIHSSCYIFKAAHPSGYSASKGFFGCKHFSKVNKKLRDLKKVEIDWQI